MFPIPSHPRFFNAIVMVLVLALGSLISLKPVAVTAADPAYKHGPDSLRNANHPRGTVTEHVLSDSKVFPGTKRRYSLDVPAQYTPKTPAALMVFQDGHTFVGERGDFRVPVVFDNLIAKGVIPVTIAVMIDPGHKGELPDKRGWKPTPTHRRVEDDPGSGDYAQFLLTEVLPPIEAKFRITNNPNLRAICGNSSGGICAFSVAWHRPDSFRKVLSHIGSFVDLRGGHNYPPMIRKTEKKPIRVLLQDGENDLDNRFGNWPLANRQMGKALSFHDYDYKLVFGQGGHNGKHAGTIFPDSLQWLWRDWEQQSP
jgi:enterochelin esterase family protein